MSCSRKQHCAACGDRTQDLSIRSPTLEKIPLRHRAPQIIVERGISDCVSLLMNVNDHECGKLMEVHII